MHLNFCKRLLGVKKHTQIDFVHGKCGRTNFQTKRFLLLINYWFKILTAEDHKYIKLTYQLMLNDIEAVPNTINWASLL